MKHKAKAIEFSWGSEDFTLVPETTLDGERLAREQAQREADRAESEQQQTKMEINPFAQPTETLATALDRKYPRRKGCGWRYQNGVRPGPRKLEQFKEVLELRGTPPLCANEGQGWDAIAQVKLFDPCGSWTWHLTEWDGHDEAFGIVDGHNREFGSIDLAILASVSGRLGIGIEIDMHWTPRPLRECLPSDDAPDAPNPSVSLTESKP